MDVVTAAQLASEKARRIFEHENEAEPWMQDYWELLAEGWSWRQAVYMLWEAQPGDGRVPKTQAELAVSVLGLTSDRVISGWKQENPAILARISRLTASAVAKARSEILAALVTSAANPSYRNHPDRKLALEMTGDYVPRQTVRVGAALPDELEDASEEELRALAYGANGGAQIENPEGADGG